MTIPNPLSPAQLTGYLAFALGVIAFLQKDDRRLRAMVGLQAFSYAVHFLLLGSDAAAVASLVTTVRAVLSLYTRSPVVAIAILIVNIGLAFVTVTGPVGWLPVAASSAGTLAFFFFVGIPMRLVLLGSTGCWLVNNVILGSIGGTLLELLIGVANGATCFRLWRAKRT
jgi:hypothetical protein